MKNDIEGVVAEIRSQYDLQENQLPPVHLWNPPLSGDIDIEIKRSGEWWYQGEPIKRQQIANLFSTILKMEEDDYFLVTPNEKWRIQVECVPFLISGMEEEGEGRSRIIVFTTLTGDCFALDKNHPIQFSGQAEDRVPIVVVRGSLTGLLSRPVYYRLAELAETVSLNGETQLGVYSANTFFALE